MTGTIKNNARIEAWRLKGIFFCKGNGKKETKFADMIVKKNANSVFLGLNLQKNETPEQN